MPSSDPSQEYPHYSPDPPVRRCAEDAAILHKGDEWEDCLTCLMTEEITVLEKQVADLASRIAALEREAAQAEWVKQQPVVPLPYQDGVPWGERQ